MLAAGWHIAEGSAKTGGRGGFSVHVIQVNSPGESGPAGLSFDPQEAESGGA